jgi:glutamate formiminotransferase/formiminotetrahydrofolate cyclodeaminase
MNLVDLDRAGLHDAFDEAVRQADALGLRVTGSELVGLVPESAMLAAGRHYLLRQGKSPGAGPDDLVAAAVRTLGLNDVTRFDPDARIIERRLRRPDRLGALPLERFVGRVAAATPTPGGGSCAALAAACSGALAGMAAGIAWERKGFEAVREELGRAALAAQDAARAALEAIDADARAYDAVVAASRLPRATPEDAARRDAAIDRASRAAAEVPLGIIERLGGLVDAIDAVVRRGSPACLSDAIGAASLAAAAAETAHANVLANLPAVRDARWTRRVRERADRRRADVAGRARAILARARRALARAAAPPGRKGGR